MSCEVKQTPTVQYKPKSYPDTIIVIDSVTKVAHDYLLKHPSWDPVYCLLIAKHSYQIGMNKEMMIAVMGKPLEVNRTVTRSGVHEQWVYDRTHYLYFDNDILTSWQD